MPRGSLGPGCIPLGAGSGYFTFRLSKALPQGKVIAIDAEPEMVRHIHRKTRTEGFANVTAQVAKLEDPDLPRDADLVFVCDVLLHVKKRADWLKAVHSQMRPGAWLVLIRMGREAGFLRIEGGTVEVAEMRTFECAGCGHRWEVPFGSGRPGGCPACQGKDFHRAQESGVGTMNGRGRGRRNRCGGQDGRGQRGGRAQSQVQSKEINE